MSLGLWSAFAASLCYGLASVLQSVGARAALPVTVRSDGSRSPHPGGSTHLRDIARQPLYVTGLLFDGAGFALSLSALRTLPLYTAEAVLAASVGVTAIGAAAVLRQPMVPLEIGSIVLLIVGLAALGSTAGRTSVAPLSDAGSIALLASSVVLAGLLVVVPSTPAGSARALAAIAGLCFGGLGITVRTLRWPGHWWLLIGHPALYSLVIFGIAGTASHAHALQRGSVTSVAAVVVALETLVPAGLGVLVLGDRPRSGSVPLAAIGFGLTVATSLLLARYAEPRKSGSDIVTASSRSV